VAKKEPPSHLLCLDPMTELLPDLLAFGAGPAHQTYSVLIEQEHRGRSPVAVVVGSRGYDHSFSPLSGSSTVPFH
jgi:hypothetical protein